MIVRLPTYWNIAQVITWICSRNETQVFGIADARPGEALKSELLSYRRPGKMRVTSQGWRFIKPPRSETNNSDSFTALAELLRAAREGRLAIFGVPPNSSEWQFVPIDALTNRPLEIGETAVGLRDMSGAFAWNHLRVLVSDVMRLWPGPKDPTVGSKQVETEIRTCLEFVLSRERSSKKEVLNASRQVIPKWTRSAFERAWQSVDPTLKIGSGKRGLGKNKREEIHGAMSETGLQNAANSGTVSPA